MPTPAHAVHPPATGSHVASTLARNRLGVFTILSTLLAAAAPLTVIAGGAVAAFAITGQTAIPIAYIVVAAGLGIFGIGYVTMARRITNAGAFYTYVTRGLGATAGVGTAFVAVLAYNVMQAGLTGGFGYVAAQLLGDYGITAPWWAWALLGWLIVAMLGLLRIELGGLVLSILLVAEMLVALIFAMVQIAHPADGQVSFTALSPIELATATGAGALLVVAVTGFVGFENGAVFSEEAKNPARTVPQATYLSLAVVALFYAFCAFALVTAAGEDAIVTRATQEGTELIFNLSSPYVGDQLILAGRILMLTSMFAAMLSFHFTSARYHFALGREGVLFRVFGRAAARTKAPVSASLLQTAITFTVIFVYAANGWDPYTQLFFWLTVQGGLGVLILLVVTSVAIAAYFLRSRRQHACADEIHEPTRASGLRPAGTDKRVGVWRGVIFPVIAAGLLGAMLWKTLQVVHVLLGVDETSPLRWQFPATFAVIAIIGMGWALYLRSARPQLYARIGEGAPAGGSR